MNATSVFRVHYDLGLVEESVLCAVRARPRGGQATFHRERDLLYEVADPDQREIQFERFHRRWFLSLRLNAPLDRALAELPSLVGTTAGCWVLRVASRKDEMADLVRRPTDGSSVGPTAAAPEPLAFPRSSRAEKDDPAIVVRLCPETLLDPDGLLGLLRHELMHLTDMLDPRFGYQQELYASEAGPSYDNLVRERYRIVWAATIDGRLARQNLLPSSGREQRLREFARAFPMLADAIELEFGRWFDARDPNHHQILAFAQDPRRLGGQLGRLDGRCPLCRFPTPALSLRGEGLPRAALLAIERSFPSWHPEQGVCIQCAALYEAYTSVEHASISSGEPQLPRA